MSEGADSITQTCENSLTTLKAEDNPEDLPPRTISYTGRRPRFGTGNVPLSPYILIDGQKLRSSLALSKKWPPRRVSFPTNDSHLVTGYLEPANPWKLTENVNRDDLILAYKDSCSRHSTDPLDSVINQLENLDISESRGGQLTLKGETLDEKHSEPLEEILKRIQFNKVDLEGTSLDDESSVILFDMLEYYESAKHLNISSNQEIGARGWQACAHMIKKTQCLEQLEAKDITLSEDYMNILSRALRLVCHLHVLKLENCGLSGRAIVILVTALKMNTGIRELYLADNGLDLYDAIQLGSLLRINNHIQLLDISNNNIQDEGVRDILEGLINQVNEDKDGKGLSILVLWNNRLTKKSSPYFSRIIALSKTLETLNIGQNMLTDEMLSTVKDALKDNHILLQLGMQSTDLTCDGIITLSEIIETNQVLQRIDLRDNNIQMTGMRALSSAMKNNKHITQIDLDDKPRIKIDGTLHQYMELVAEIRGCCSENEKNRTLDENTEGSESPQHHSRICSASSRKISLTCQTLPCTSPSTTPIQSDESGRSMLEPKRASGGRLRSPAPSPIPSPVASPIPSPSRSRFVVSRVPEASLRSTDSSASSSPVTPPSLGSSPTCCFPSASGSSRFRVSIVESASTVPSPKSVVASSKTNVTIGFNYKVDTGESVDSDDVFGNELATSDQENNDKLSSASGSVTSFVANVGEDETVAGSTRESTDVENLSTNERSVTETGNVRSKDGVEFLTAEDVERRDATDNQSNIPALETVEAADAVAVAVANSNESTNDVETNVNISEDDTDARETSYEPDATTGASFSETIEVKQNSSVQKHTSNLEKLLALFQHPSSFFSDSTSCINQLNSKTTIQDGVSSVMSFGDKFHNYLKDGRDRVNSHTTSQWTSDDALPVKTKSKSSGSQLSSFQSLTNIFSSFKLDANLNLFEQSKPSPKSTETAGFSLKKELTDIQEERADETANSTFPPEGETKSSDRSFQDARSNTDDGSKDLVLENRVPSAAAGRFSIVPDGKSSVRISKFLDVPIFSVFELADEKDVVTEANVEKIVDSILVEETCDKTLTDSINPTSDSNSSSCKVTCDIAVLNDARTVDKSENNHDTIRLNLNAKEKAAVVDCSRFNEQDASCALGERNVNNISLSYDETKVDDVRLSKVTSVRSIDNNNERERFANSHKTSGERADDCKMYWTSTTVVNSTGPDLSLTPKDSNTVFHENTEQSTSEVYEEEVCVEKSASESNRFQDAESTGHRNLEAKVEDFAENSEFCVKKSASESNRFQDAESTGHRNLEAKVEDFAENSEENLKKTPVEVAVPTVVLSQHKSAGAVDESSTDFDKSDPEDLIFCMTDISTDGTSVEEELSPGVSNWSTDGKSATFYDLPQAARSPTNLLIEKPENVHRNSQDSGIGEANLSTLDDNIPESLHSQPRESFQESVDSGIESECSSVCVKVETMDGARDEVSFGKKSTEVEGRETLGEFDSSLIQRMQCTNTDSVTDLAHSYFNSIKCAVLAPARSIAGLETDDTTPAGTMPEESTAVIAESSTVIRAASPK